MPSMHPRHVRRLCWCRFYYQIVTTLPEGDNNMTQKQRLRMRGIHPTSFMSAHSTTRTAPPTQKKTEFLLIGLKQQLSKIQHCSLTTSHSARNLGFIFDEHLTFSDQITAMQILSICCPSFVVVRVTSELVTGNFLWRVYCHFLCVCDEFTVMFFRPWRVHCDEFIAFIELHSLFVKSSKGANKTFPFVYTLCLKKTWTVFREAITVPNINGFSKFFHCWIQN